MEGCNKLLLKEALKFVEHCQSLVFSGYINFEKYDSLTKLKIRFINDVCKELDIAEGSDIRCRVKNILCNHFFILNLYRELVGK